MSPPPTEPRYATGLNARQREAVEHDQGPLIVLAGPGTGKTRVIVHRVARLLELGAGSGPVDPSTVLAATFTVKAAAEMRHRLRELVGPGPAERVHVRTFHGLGRWLIRRFGDVLGLRPSWRIMDSAERTRLMRRVVADECLLDDRDAALGPDAFVADALRFVEACRHQGVTPAECSREARRSLDAAAGVKGESARAEAARADRFARRARAYEAFVHRCVRAGTLTLDDLVALPIDLLADPRIGPIVRQDIRHIVVDEFQDVNPAQVRLLRLLAPPAEAPTGPGPDLCVVGDDDQAIYAFRGASERSFEQFRAVWGRRDGGGAGGAVRTVALVENYRSDPAILQAAGAVIARASSRFAPEKAIAAMRPASGAGAVEGIILDDDDDAGSVIAAEVERSRSGGAPESVAVIARTHVSLSRVAEELSLRGMPVSYAARPDDVADVGVKDLLAWIEALIDPGAIGPVQRLLSRPPMSLPAPALSKVIRQEQAARSRSRAFALEGAGAGATEPSAPGSDPLDWLERAGASVGLDPPPSQTIARYVVLHREFAKVAAASPAHEVVRRIIADAALAEADGLEGRARARRVRSLITFLQFARARADRFDAPGRLSELWSYFADLSDDERRSICGGGQTDDAIDAEDLPDEPSQSGSATIGAVTLLTAHACKGLEFDAVYVVKVRPGGFPESNREGDEPVLPLDWLDRLAKADGLAPLDRTAARADEQRRLFYVACTRARRRLVLLAKSKKKATDVTDYFIELEGVASDIPMSVRKPGAGPGDPSGPPQDPADLPDALTRAVEAGADASVPVRVGVRARDRARRVLADLLAELQSPARARAGDAAALLELAERVREQSLHLATAAGLAQVGEVPAWSASAGPGVARYAQTLADWARAADTATGAATTPFTAPLSLSYTKISAYLRCPRCFYLDARFGLRESPGPHMALGAAAHQALHQYYLEVQAADAEGQGAPGLDRLLRLARQALEQSWPGAQPMPPEAWTQLRGQMSTLHATLHDPAAHLLFLEQLVKVPYEHRGVHELTAKFDRVDQIGPGRFRIIDYKTGQASKTKLEPKKDDLQLGLYAMALRSFLGAGDAQPADVGGRAEYWILSTGQVGAIDLAAINLDAVRRKIDKAIDGMLDGDFLPAPGCDAGCGIFSLE